MRLRAHLTHELATLTEQQHDFTSLLLSVHIIFAANAGAAKTANAANTMNARFIFQQPLWQL